MAQTVDMANVPGLLRPGQPVFVAGSSGASPSFMQALLSDPERNRELQLLTSYVPGVNPLNIDALHPSAHVSGLFMQPAWSRAQRDGQYRHLPLSYGSFTRHLADNVDIDLLVVQVAPADSQGRFSLGPAVEFVPTALGKSQRVLALINPNTPHIPGAISLTASDFTYQCAVDDPLPCYIPEQDPRALVIAQHVASLIPNGAALQMGLGRIPTALAHALTGHSRLRLFSGMLSDGLLLLSDAGALDERFAPTACVLLGSPMLYQRAADVFNVRVLGCDITHDPCALLHLDRFFAVNSALEVDLFGQCNLEHASGRAISGAGGAPDYARAAKHSRGGVSIIALNAQRAPGKGSRIVPALAANAVSSLGRNDVDCVITEYGIADLRGASVHERAERLIAVAAPEFQQSLSEAWGQIAARL